MAEPLQRTFGLNIRQETLRFSTMMAEVCWLFPLILFFTQPMKTAISNLLLLILTPFAVAFYSTRILQKFKSHPFIFSCAHIATALLTIFASTSISMAGEYSFADFPWVIRLIDRVAYYFSNWGSASFPTELVSIAITCFFWIRGAILTWQSLEFDYTTKEFQAGIATLYLMVIVQAGGGLVLVEAPILVLSFYFFSLVALATSHLEGMAVGKYVSMKNRWLWLPIASSATILCLGAVLAMVASPEIINSFLKMNTFFLTQLWQIILYILNLMPKPNIQPAASKGSQSPGFHEEDVVSGQPPPSWLVGISYWLMLGAIFTIALLVLLMVIRGLRILSRSRPETLMVEQVVEHEAQRRKLIAWLRTVIDALVTRLMQLFGRGSTKDLAEQVICPFVLSARELYRRFLRLMASHGYLRMCNETPFEYLDRMMLIFPSIRLDVKCFTDVYVKARYGLTEIGQEELRLMNEELVRIGEAIKVGALSSTLRPYSSP